MIKRPDEILQEMAKTYKERSKQYGDNWLKIGNVLSALYPAGITLTTPDDFNHFHLFLLMLVKVTRLSESNLTHVDSAHDAAVYAAMLEALMSEPAK